MLLINISTHFQTLHEEKPIHTLSMNGMGTIGHGHLPPPPIVGPPLAGLASLGLGPTQKEWDQLSMYSQRSAANSAAPRGRLYQMDRGMLQTKLIHTLSQFRFQFLNFLFVIYLLYRLNAGSINGGYIPEDARSHISHLSQSRGPKSRATSIADLTGKPAYPGMGMGLGMSRPGNKNVFPY